MKDSPLRSRFCSLEHAAIFAALRAEAGGSAGHEQWGDLLAWLSRFWSDLDARDRARRERAAQPGVESSGVGAAWTCDEPGCQRPGAIVIMRKRAGLFPRRFCSLGHAALWTGRAALDGYDDFEQAADLLSWVLCLRDGAQGVEDPSRAVPLPPRGA